MKTITASLLVATALAASAEADTRQLIAAAGLTAAEAEGLSLTQIAALKFNRESSADDQQPVFRIHGTAPRPFASRAQLAAGAGLSPAEAAGLGLDEIAAHYIATAIERSGSD